MENAVWWFALLACAPESLPAMLVGRGGGRGYWPPESTTAIRGAVETGLPAIELDLALTADRVPVLLDGPWIDPAACTDASGGLLSEIVRIDALDAATLVSEYRCGGLPDPVFPNALVVAEPPATFDGLLFEIRDAPDLLEVHLDIQQEPGLTPSPARFARAVLEAWTTADLPQELHVHSDRPEVIAAFEEFGREVGFDVPTVLEVDPYALEGLRLAGGLDYVALTREAGADGIALRWDRLDRFALSVARREGLPVLVYTVDHAAGLAEWTRPGRATWVLTDYPGDVP